MNKIKFFLSAFVIVFTFHWASAQQINPTDYLSSLPNNIELDNTVKRSYQMTTDYYDYNLKGDFLNKKRVTGTITHGLNGNSVQWNDVCISFSNTLNAEFSKGEYKDFMHNFTYIPNEEVLTQEFFNKNLPKADPHIMNLIWDALAFDALAYSYWNSLRLNEEFQAKSMNSELKLANIGTFENKDIRITWLGITKINDKLCAILKYSVMNNPLKVEFENISMSGRSHYWGEIYVSLSDKQIEYANLTEDVLTDMQIKGQANNMLGYTVRTIDLVKVK